jgi:hypothetical protein
MLDSGITIFDLEKVILYSAKELTEKRSVKIKVMYFMILLYLFDILKLT